MKATIVEEAHNHVVWETRTSTLWIVLGLFLGGLCVAAFLLLVPFIPRWDLAGVMMALTVLVVVFLALTTPLAERGELERTLDGGSLVRMRQWLFFGKRLAWQAELESIVGFRPEARLFEDTGEQLYTRSRLWVFLADADPLPLTDWLDAPFVHTLGKSLAKAGRCTFEPE
ncbi:MAG: hypothetical protein JXR84_11145 [Anaerolineae bacterium]|nr:hypothetical protein [Anaerolineae bacterium]